MVRLKSVSLQKNSHMPTRQQPLSEKPTQRKPKATTEKPTQRKPITTTEKLPQRKPKATSERTVTEATSMMDFLRESFPDKSRTTIKSLLAHQQVTLSGRVIKQFDHILKPGDVVAVHWEKGKTTLESPLLSIVFEDKHLLVVEKAAGLLSISTQKEQKKTAYSMLSEYVKKQHPGNKIFVVHRLDRETSGLMLFAKSEEVQYLMQNNWRYAVNQRRYVAVVEGKLETGDGSGKGTIKSYLWESKALIVYASPNPEDGDLAVTHYTVLDASNDYSLVELELETGRKNQIRVQMNSIGYPLVGDLKYGGHASNLKRLALHAHVLSFTHPITGHPYAFETPIPESFRKLVKTIRKQ